MCISHSNPIDAIAALTSDTQFDSGRSNPDYLFGSDGYTTLIITWVILALVLLCIANAIVRVAKAQKKKAPGYKRRISTIIVLSAVFLFIMFCAYAYINWHLC
jgi:hypothetical protein